MIVGFGSRGTEDIFYNRNTAAARRTCPSSVWKAALRKLELLDGADEVVQLLHPTGNRLESLSGNLQGWHSIRINRQWRIIFRWTTDGAEEVEIVDYHW